jgi:hypothetical protein
MSAIVYNVPENMNLEVSVFRVKEGGGRLARNVSMCLAQYSVNFIFVVPCIVTLY